MGHRFSSKADTESESIETEKYYFFHCEKDFWNEYYRQTSDYSIGPWRISQTPTNEEATNIFRKRWTINNNIYFLPKDLRVHLEFSDV